MHNAIVFTCGLLDTGNGKTAHGLIRGSDKFKVSVIVDAKQAGRDAGYVLDGIHRNIPVVATVEEALKAFPAVTHAIVGLAPIGGKIPPELLSDLLYCAQNALHIVSGLHEYVGDHMPIAGAAAQAGVTITDIRRPKHKSELHFWSGKIYEVTCPIVGVIGMDCAIGKRSTTRFLLDACKANNLKAEMIYTGQTGWMQSGRYGFIFDSTYNDFVSGELEHAIHTCWVNEQPDIIFVEGQSGLRNPSGPCGSEILISANAKHVVLLAAPKREYFDDDPAWGRMPTIASEIELIKMYGSEVVGVALNTKGCSVEEARAYKKSIAQEINLPVSLPIEEGLTEIMESILTLVKRV